jgi:glycosyltransferase involved in cell wall biosynthesis
MGLNVVLNLAGGAYRQARQAHVEKLVETLGISAWVRFLGVRNDIPELMGASDVVIHASHSEGLPITILEALASRTPVVASDIPACREALDGGRCGVLVPPKDPVALANGVKSLLENSGQRRRVVETAFDHVRERYHHRRMAAGYAALIEQAGSR